MSVNAKKRKRLDVKTKLAALNFLSQPGATHEQAALEFLVARPTVSKIWKEGEIIKQVALESNQDGLKKVSLSTRVQLLTDIVHQWHMRVEINAPTLNMTGWVLKNKALLFQDKILQDFAECLKPSDIVSLQAFVASNGWLKKYLKRLSTSSRKRCREHNSINPMQMEKRLHEICKALIDVPLECIINIDELALQHCTTSSRSYCTVNSDGHGVKWSKEQITVTLGVSASGDKFTTQVITKSACPRALNNIPGISMAFGTIYDHQVKAWQDTSSYMCLLNKYNRIAKNRILIFYILQDNC
jgi:hypothetical protein